MPPSCAQSLERPLGTMWPSNALSTRTARVVGLSPAQQMSDIKHERGVALAHMLSSQFPIYPDCGCVEYGLEFDPDRRVLPFTRSVEGSPVPGDTAIINKSGVNLPSVGHAHLAPGVDGIIGSVPTLRLTNASGIRPKPPLAAKAHRLRRGQARCFLACRESRRAHGARSQDSGLSQEFSTRMHGKVPCPITITGHHSSAKRYVFTYLQTSPN